MSRFDFVKYDAQSQVNQDVLKQQFEKLEEQVCMRLHSPRAKALVLTKLEEAYMWVGKAIRDDQIDIAMKAVTQ